MNKITISNGVLEVPDKPVIPFIEGDGIGVDIWPATRRIVDAAVAACYGGQRQIEWREVLAGQKAFDRTGEWLPAETLEIFREYLVGIKGPLTTPIGGGIRSLNVALRQELDLYVCQRPTRYFQGVVTPLKRPQDVDMVIFRENTEDIYAGIEWQTGTPEAIRLREFLINEMGVRKIRFPESSSFGTARAGGDSVCDRPSPAVGDFGAQGEYHEVHRGFLQELGVRVGGTGVRRTDLHLGRVGTD